MKNQPITSLIASAMAFALSACGGGDAGGVAVAPPPPPGPPPVTLVRTELIGTATLAPNPGTTSGSYGAIAMKLDNSTPLANGTVSLAVDSAAKTYTLTVRADGFDALPANFAMGNLGTSDTYRETWSNNTQTTPTNPHNIGWLSDSHALPNGDRFRGEMTIYTAGVIDPGQSADFNGDSYVSLGSWYLDQVKPASGGSPETTVGHSAGYFAIGTRTPAGSIPLAGTAQYKVTSDIGNLLNCSDWGCFGLALEGSALSVDFGARTIAAETPGYSENARYTSPAGAAYDYAFNISKLTGSSPIDSNGDFAIALSGSGSTKFTPLNGAAALPDIAKTLDGFINGAFFGPNAEAIGGVYSVETMSYLGEIYHTDGAFTSRKP